MKKSRAFVNLAAGFRNINMQYKHVNVIKKEIPKIGYLERFTM